MGDYSGDLIDEAEQNRRTMARGICHAMVAVDRQQRRPVYVSLLLILYTIPAVGPPRYFFGGRRSKNRVPDSTYLFYFRDSIV